MPENTVTGRAGGFQRRIVRILLGLLAIWATDVERTRARGWDDRTGQARLAGLKTALTIVLDCELVELDEAIAQATLGRTPVTWADNHGGDFGRDVAAYLEALGILEPDPEAVEVARLRAAGAHLEGGDVDGQDVVELPAAGRSEPGGGRPVDEPLAELAAVEQDEGLPADFVMTTTTVPWEADGGPAVVDCVNQPERQLCVEGPAPAVRAFLVDALAQVDQASVAAELLELRAVVDDVSSRRRPLEPVPAAAVLSSCGDRVRLETMDGHGVGVLSATFDGIQLVRGDHRLVAPTRDGWVWAFRGTPGAVSVLIIGPPNR